MNMIARKNPDALERSGTAEHRPFRTRIPGYTIRLLALLGIALLVWKVITVSVLESEQEDAIQALRDSTDHRISVRTEQLGRTAGEGFALAILQPVKNGDAAQLRRICGAFAQRSAVNDYLVVDPAGIIIAAAEETRVGESVDTNLRRTISAMGKPIVDTIENGLTRVTVPLRDESGRYGTLILTFRLP